MARLEGNVFVDDPPAQCEPTRAQYLNKQVSFEDYYRAIARTSGVTFINAPREFLGRCKKALDAGDIHLNTIPLSQWDDYAYAAQGSTSQALKIHGDFWSLAGGVCIAKQMARDAVKGRETDKEITQDNSVTAAYTIEQQSHLEDLLRSGKDEEAEAYERSLAG